MLDNLLTLINTLGKEVFFLRIRKNQADKRDSLRIRVPCFQQAPGQLNQNAVDAREMLMREEFGTKIELVLTSEVSPV
jgi:hypothetical protein